MSIINTAEFLPPDFQLFSFVLMKLGLSPNRIELSVWGGSGRVLVDCFLPEDHNRHGFCSKPRRRTGPHRRTTALMVTAHTIPCGLTQNPCLLHSQKPEAELLGENGKLNFNSHLLGICLFIDLKENVISSPNFFVLCEFLIPETRKENNPKYFHGQANIKNSPSFSPLFSNLWKNKADVKIMTSTIYCVFLTCLTQCWDVDALFYSIFHGDADPRVREVK